MRFPLSDEDRDEIEAYQLRSSCQHCFYFVRNEQRCAHEWPSKKQAKWPLQQVREISLCKEFELD